MKSSKTTLLIDSFNQSDLKSFFKHLGTVKRKKLKPLAKYILVNRDTPYNKQKLYKLLYNETYDSAKDFVLRNELRHLNNEIVSFMTKSQLGAKEIDQQISYVTYLCLNSTHIDFVVAEIDSILKKENVAIEKQLKLIDLKVDLLLNKKSIDPIVLSHLYPTLNHQKALQKQHFINTFREIESNIAYAERIKSMYSPKGIVYTKLASNLDIIENESLIAKYYRIKAQSHTCAVEVKIATLNEALKILELIKDETFNNENEHFQILSWIAREYFLNHQYAAAISSFEAMSQYVDSASLNLVSGYYFNYCSALLRNGDYNKVLEIYKVKEDLIRLNPKLKDRLITQKAMALCFSEKYEAASAIIPPLISSENEQIRFYYRFIQSICFYGEGMLDLAENETKNVYQQVIYHEQHASTKSACSAFKRFFRILAEYSNNKTALKNALTELKTSIVKGHNKDVQDWHTDIIPLKWLTVEIDKLSKK